MPIDPDLLKFQAQYRTAKTIHLSTSKLGEKAKYIADSLKASTALKCFSILNSEINPKEAEYIADVLKETTTLSCLFIGYDNITGPGTKYIIDALRVNKSLDSLLFINNVTGDEPGKCIVDCLKVNKTLIKVVLSEQGFSQEIRAEVDALTNRNQLLHSEISKFITHNSNNIAPTKGMTFNTLKVTKEQEQAGFTEVKFCALLNKANISYLKHGLGAKCVDNFKYLVDANFFKISSVCKEFQYNHLFKSLPEEILVQITCDSYPVALEPTIPNYENIDLKLVGNIETYKAAEASE
jgi:hypothetical protein